MTMTRHEFEARRRSSQKLYHPLKMGDESFARIQHLIRAFNAAPFDDNKKELAALKAAFFRAGKNVELTAPVYFTHGNNTSFGDYVYINKGFTVLDEAQVKIGSRVFIGPDVSIYTAGHPLHAAVRMTNLEYARPVIIEDDVWIGGRTVINPGVKISRRSVIASGSVVTHDIGESCLAAGVPCREIRKIGEIDFNQEAHEFYEYILSLEQEGLTP